MSGSRSAVRGAMLAMAVLVACASGSPLLQTPIEPAKLCEAVRSAAPPFEAADVARGARRFETDCAQCHSLSADRERLPGPHLHAIVARQIGATESFRYSRAFRDRQDKWTLAALDDYIEDPEWFIPGTRMIYAGLNDRAARLDLIAFLSCETITR